MAALMGYRWGGNVREMWNAMQYSWVMASDSGGMILPMHLPPFVFSQPAAPVMPMAQPYGHHNMGQGYPMAYGQQPPPGFHPAQTIDQPRSMTLEEIERDQILRVLDKHQGNKPAVAAELGISLKTLYNKLNRYAEIGLAAAG